MNQEFQVAGCSCQPVLEKVLDWNTVIDQRKVFARVWMEMGDAAPDAGPAVWRSSNEFNEFASPCFAWGCWLTTTFTVVVCWWEGNFQSNFYVRLQRKAMDVRITELVFIQTASYERYLAVQGHPFNFYGNCTDICIFICLLQKLQ